MRRYRPLLLLVMLVQLWPAQAVQSQTAEPETLEVAASLHKRGLAEQEKGELQKAQQDFQKALAIREKLAPDSIDLAATLSRLGGIQWQLGHLEDSEKYFQRVLAIHRKQGPDTRSVAETLLSLGVVAWTGGNLQTAEDYFHRALEIQQLLAPGSLEMAATLNNLANVIRDRGDLVKAEQQFQQALAIYEKFPGNNFLPTVLLNLGNIAWDRGDISKAEEFYTRALSNREVMTPGPIAQCLSNLGLVRWHRGDLAGAEEFHTQALALRQQISPESLEVAESLLNLGGVAARRGDLASAGEYDQRAYALAQKLAPGSLTMADIENDLGDVARDRGDLAEAEDFYRQALAVREKRVPFSLAHAESLASLAMVMRDRGRLSDSARLFQQALDALESQTARLGGSEDIRSEFRAGHAGLYQQYLDLLAGQNEFDLAFQVAERSRARTLLEILNEAGVDIRKGASPELQQQSLSLRQTLGARLSSRAEPGVGDDQAAAIQQEVEKLLAEYRDVEARIRAGNPGYAALSQPEVASAGQVQHDLLDSGTVLLEYALGEKRSYLWVITPEFRHHYELPGQAAIEAAARDLYEALTARNIRIAGETARQRRQRWQRADRRYPEAAGALGRMVLAPAAADLGWKRLLIVSDGALQYIPFAVLPVPSSSLKLGGMRPLILEHEIVELPSVSTLPILRREEAGRSARRVVTVFADPVFGQGDDRISSLKEIRGPRDAMPVAAALHPADRDTGANGPPARLSFSRLPFSRREAQTIYSIAPRGEATLRLDFDASKSAVTGGNLRDYRILHFATHGLLDSQHPELSALVFSLVDRHGRPQDGFLRLIDIYNLDLNADLVVLSACQTAMGKQAQREGVIGLTRGFMYAGATRVMASLWSVDDEATAELMKKFYESMLRQGQSPSQALRTAQIWMYSQKNWKTPYYWGGFIMQGEWKKTR